VHGNAEDVLVRGLQFGDEGVGEGENLALFGGAGLLRGVGGSDPGSVDGGNGSGGKVARNDFTVGVGALPVVDDLVAEMAGDGGFAEGLESICRRVGIVVVLLTTIDV
jgi:hypothetical protein